MFEFYLKVIELFLTIFMLVIQCALSRLFLPSRDGVPLEMDRRLAAPARLWRLACRAPDMWLPQAFCLRFDCPLACKLWVRLLSSFYVALGSREVSASWWMSKRWQERVRRIFLTLSLELQACDTLYLYVSHCVCNVRRTQYMVFEYGCGVVLLASMLELLRSFAWTHVLPWCRKVTIDRIRFK